MSTATKRGKLLPDLLVARDDAQAPPLGSSDSEIDSEAHQRSRPGILNWVLVRRADVLNAIEVALAGRAASPALARSEIGLTQTVERIDRVVGRKRNGHPAAAPAMFCEKGAATPAASRPSCSDNETPEETAIKTASCGRRMKSKARRTP